MTKKKWLIYGVLVVFGMSLFIFLDLKNTTIPYDDAYSVFMIKQSYADIVSTTAKDVHPPLYYWGLKTYSQIAGDSIFALRFFSALGVLATLLLGCFPVRKLFGERVSILFIVLLIITPVSQYLATEIRMYSWTMFFVLACALYGYKVYKFSGKKNWLLFLITGVCAAYLHNYGLLSVLGIYVIFVITLIINDRKRIWHLFACGVLFSLIYLPWLIQLITQMQSIAGDYWIQPLTLNDLFLHIYYFYSPKEIWLPFTDFSKNQMIVWLVLILAIQLVLSVKVLIEGYKDKNILSVGAILAFIAFLFPVFVGAVVSVVSVPVLVTRYMTCSFALFALSLAFILAKAAEFPFYKKLSCIFLFLLFIDGGIRVYSNLDYYHQTEEAYNDIRQFTGDNGQVFFVNDFSYHVMPRLQLIVPDNEFYVLIGDKEEDLTPFLFKEEKAIDYKQFILVHQEREAIQPDFRNYWVGLKENYIVVDSLYASDIYLYKMKAK